MKKYLTILFFTLRFISTSFASEREMHLFVKEMNCPLCVYLVNKQLRNIDGVSCTKADMKQHTVKVITNNTVINQQLINAIEKLNYSAEVMTF
ncbi:mercuric ion binding protein [Nicoletella semolina]|uniref:Mercuric ion binding protein n=1 Tax=Nicoletella semolina TaxID=271160 RepID=A0A4R2N7R1_9PAST|nr:heavy-metal-associated domain-containing protein [Nicoletella semolina]MDH2924594.1 mercuric reductase [Nicoletella semolina]TCP16959.1 mercuric ion binding protein [Nicoletella semolina]